MSIPETTLVSAYAYLAQQVQTLLLTAGETSVRLSVGEPIGGNDPLDVIQFGGFRRRENPETFIGSGATDWLKESYDIIGVASSARDTAATQWDNTQPLVLIQRALNLVNYVEVAVRTDPSLGGLVVQAYPSSSASPTGPRLAENGFMVMEVEFAVHVDTLN